MSEILQQALRSSNFEEIENILNKNPSEFDRINQYSKGPFYSALLKNNQFSILEILIVKGFIETDLYEYESFLSASYIFSKSHF